MELLKKNYKDIAKRLNRQDIFLVGGCVRDVLLGITNDPDDLDVTLAGKPDDIFAQINKENSSIFKTEKFGTITILPKDSDKKIEITPFREEGGYADFRHPDEIIRSQSLLSDAKRRDFTINCMYFCVIDFDGTYPDFSHVVHKERTLDQQNKVFILHDPELIGTLFDGDGLNTFKNRWKETIKISGEYSIIVDPYEGMKDIKRGKIRAVGEPDKRFQEDALRIIRGLRFLINLNCAISRLPKQKVLPQVTSLQHTSLIEELFAKEHTYFDMENKTRRSLKKNYYLVQHIAKERIKDEIVKVFKEDNPFGFVSLLDEANILKYIFPAVYSTKQVEQPVRYHPFDVYAHTMLVLFHLQKINSNYLVKLGTLYHDVGKTEQYYSYFLDLSEDEIKKIHGSWVNHINCGSDFTRKDMQALGFSNKEVEEIAWYVQRHMKPGEILMAKAKNIPKKIRALLSEYGYDKVKNVFDICTGDRLGQFNPAQVATSDDVAGLYTILDLLNSTEGQFTHERLEIDGNDLMSDLKLAPGPILKELLEKALDRTSQDIENRNTKDSIIDYLKSYLKNKAKKK